MFIDFDDKVIVTGNQFREWRETNKLTRAAAAVVLRKSHQTIVSAEQRGDADISQPLARLLVSQTERKAVVTVVCDIEPKEVIRVHK